MSGWNRCGKIDPTVFIEGVVLILPLEAGGRALVVRPRDGSYRPFARLRGGGPLMRLCFIEGPPRLAPGDLARVVVEIESGLGANLGRGEELDLVETGPEAVGVLTVSRVWPDVAITA